MLLLSLSLWRRLLFQVGGFPLPRGAQAPAMNEIVLLAERRRGRFGRVHVVRSAARVRTVEVGRFSPWRGATEWVVRPIAIWSLETPFTLEGIQLTPNDYFLLPRPARLDPMDAGEVGRRQLLKSSSTVVFSHEPLTPDDVALRHAFHRLWSKAAWHDNYVKKEWQELATMLDKRGVRT